ncbi:stage 0 sporulation family protein [Peptostreptococcus stomatis]|uniref:PSP1 C-terminal domain protein n=1 Tax=Peptostreptococcus stomatis DSM 17678 TaxID=596315 RepID=E0E2L8_9FIRM|nr:stage 0 sporulation family protein [Peptostreptococcus stomatis]EFM64865.1 PSP1 C-terminal domain protein [Peptostreptococcus stomatis DSM 17678]MBL6465958.1 stage 0 sporulation family protein [Peptostreptococcus stomatis]
MVKIVGVRFKPAGKIYYFDPGDLKIETGNDVIVETARGLEYGMVVIRPKLVKEEDLISPLKPIIRIASDDDAETYLENKVKTKEAYDICDEKIKDHDLEMYLIDCEYTFDRNKLIFYFTADGRIDFRELVKDLAAIFKTRIELRQIGVRDEAKILNAIGPCGRSLCCSTWIGEFMPVSIKMAKDQGLSLNPAKISGVCGRLFCCLKYEAQGYADAVKKMPSVGWLVKDLFTEKKGKVIDVNHLLENIKVEFEDKTVGVLAEGDYKVIKASKKDNSQQANQEKLDKEALAELKKLEREK